MARSVASMEQRREYARRERARRREVIQAIRSAGACADCGGAAEHFHHVDPATKLFTVGGGASAAPSMAVLLAEVAKCVLLCTSCHNGRHKQRKPPPAEGRAKGRHVRWHVRRGIKNPACEFCA